VLSLYRFKRWLYERQLADGKLTEAKRRDFLEQLRKWEQSDPRSRGHGDPGPALSGFWARWHEHYGESGLVHPRGDRLLTTLALRAMKELKPRLMMVNYNDCDYVHWGYLSHYTTGISIMDEGIREMVAAVEADPEYRDNTVFVIVPDCGRDTNPMSAVPCQHHFNSRSAHEIFALLMGKGVAEGRVVDKEVRQVDVAPTVGRLMGFRVEHAEGRVLEEVWA
jgi:arylsulfatase A-like enzyme